MTRRREARTTVIAVALTIGDMLKPRFWRDAYAILRPGIPRCWRCQDTFTTKQLLADHVADHWGA